MDHSRSLDAQQFSVVKLNIPIAVAQQPPTACWYKNHESRAISWVPLAGMMIPDQTQYMRIRLKIAVIDVKSGQWDIFIPKSKTTNASKFAMFKKYATASRLTN